MNPIKITMKENYTEKNYSRDVKMFEDEGSFLGSEKNSKGQIVFIIDKDKKKEGISPPKAKAMGIRNAKII